MKSLFGETPTRILAFCALLISLILAFIAVEILAVPFVAALFVVYLFDPAVVALQRRGMDRGGDVKCAVAQHADERDRGPHNDHRYARDRPSSDSREQKPRLPE